MDHEITLQAVNGMTEARCSCGTFSFCTEHPRLFTIEEVYEEVTKHRDEACLAE